MRRQAAIRALRSTGWLSQQPAAFQDDLLRQAELRSLSEGATIQLAGDPAGGLYGLASGQISVINAPASVHSHLVKIALPGWWFGDVALISGATRVVSLVARSPIDLLVISRATILQLAERDPATWRRIAQITAQHLSDALQIIGAMSLTDPDARIALALARLIETRPTDVDSPVEVNVTRSELGEMARMTRNAAAPALRRLEAEGLVSCGYRRMSIPSVRRLWAYLKSRPDVLEQFGSPP